MAENGGNNQVFLHQNRVNILRMVHESLTLLLGIIQVVRASFDEKKHTARLLLMIASLIVCAARCLLLLYIDTKLNQNIDGPYRQHRRAKINIGVIMLCALGTTSLVKIKIGGVAVLFVVIAEMVFFNILDRLLLPEVPVEQNV